MDVTKLLICRSKIQKTARFPPCPSSCSWNQEVKLSCGISSASMMDRYALVGSGTGPYKQPPARPRFLQSIHTNLRCFRTPITPHEDGGPV